MTAIPITKLDIQEDIDALKQANKDTRSAILKMQEDVACLTDINNSMLNINIEQSEILEEIVHILGRIESKM